MTRGTLRRLGASTLILVTTLLVGAGCGLLDVQDPTAVMEKDLANSNGSNMIRRAALYRLYDAIAYATLQSGLLSDEFYHDPTPLNVSSGSMPANFNIDRRDDQLLASGESSKFAYQKRNDVRLDAGFAIHWLNEYAPESVKRIHIGQMLKVRGYIVLGLAEDFCGGLPLNEVVDYKPVYGKPMSTDELFERALLYLDSAVVFTADSSRIAIAAHVIRGRALLGLGRFAEAAASVAAVPTGYKWLTEFTNAAGGQSNTQLVLGGALSSGNSVADRDGGNGLDFISANDPRVETKFVKVANYGSTGIYGLERIKDNYSQIVIASGVEARLIEAEAALRANDTDGNWLAILNDLRTSCTDAASCPSPAPAGSGGVAGLPLLADPGTTNARVDLLFRERAFWLFATGHRLGDLRRLVRYYNRAPETVFPTGTDVLGGSYGVATSLPFPWEEENVQNPAITGCVD